MWATFSFPAGVAICCAVFLVGAALAPPAPAALAERELHSLPRVAPGLTERATEDGAAKVIVDLQLPFVAEGELPGPLAVARQRESIARTSAAVLQQLRGTEHRVARHFSTVPGIALEVSPTALRELARNPLVASIREDGLVRPQLAESVPLVEADQAWWKVGKTGYGRAIAVIDTGIDKSHPALVEKVNAEACFADGVFTAPRGDCPNGQPRQTGSGAGVPCTFSAQCDHGTHVGGIAAANHPMYPGVAKAASLVSVQVFHRSNGCHTNPGDPTACSPSAYYSDINAALEWLYLERGNLPDPLAAVNLSLSDRVFTAPCDDLDPVFTNAVANLRSVGTATVAASGNDQRSDALGWPACVSSVISVGATYKSDRIVEPCCSPYSNSASFLSLLAPGGSITSSVPGGGFAAKTGTSMAAPHVAGAWAIIKQAFPAASVDSVLAKLQATGVPITDPRNGLNKPRIRVHEALQAMAGLLFVSNRGSDNLDIYTMNQDGSQQTNLTRTSAWEEHPAWSPDRTKIAFSAHGQIWVMNTDGSGRTVVTSSGFGSEPAWSRSGSRLTFTRYDHQSRRYDIYAVNLDGSGLTRLTTMGDNRNSDWSPSGSKIVFSSDRAGPSSLYTMNADGTGQARLTYGPSHMSPDWSPDGYRILFSERGVGIYTIRPDGTDLRLVMPTDGESADDVAWSPLGDQIAFSSVPNQGLFNTDIYKMQWNGTGRIGLTNSSGRDEQLVW